MGNVAGVADAGLKIQARPKNRSTITTWRSLTRNRIHGSSRDELHRALASDMTFSGREEATRHEQRSRALPLRTSQ